MNIRHRNVHPFLTEHPCTCNACCEEDQNRNELDVTNVLRLLVTTNASYLEPDTTGWGAQDHTDSWREIEDTIIKAINAYGFEFNFTSQHGARPTVTTIEWEGENNDE